MANIISTLKNNYAGGNGSITADQVKIYAFDGQPNDAYTGFTFTIENKATTTCIIDCIEFNFRTDLIPDSLSNSKYAGLLSILQTTFKNSSSISVTYIFNGLVTIQAKFPSSQQIKLSRNHKVNFNLLGLYAKSNLKSANQELKINFYYQKTIIAASTSEFVIDSTQVSPTTQVLIITPPKITIDNFSFGVIGNSYIINTREEQFIDLYMNVVGITADAPLTFTNSLGNEPHLCIGFYTNSANTFSPEPLQDSLFIDTEAGLANYTVSYKGQNKIVENNNIGNIFRAMGDSIVTADLPMNNTISLSSRANFCAAKFIIDAGTSSLSGWYRFKIKIKLLNDINYGIVNISIQVYIDNKTLYYEVPITISPFNIVNGNFGIGIANPQSKLEVNGNFEVINGFLKIGTSNSLGNTGGYGSRIEFGSAGYTNSKPNVSIEESFGLNLIGSTVKPVKIISADLIVNDGKLGIGNAYPTKKLDVTGDAHITGVTTLDGNVGIGNVNPTKKLDVTGDAHITGVTTLDGNVGIGNAYPTKKLDVIGDAQIYGSTILDGNVSITKLTLGGFPAFTCRAWAKFNEDGMIQWTKDMVPNLPQVLGNRTDVYCLSVTGTMCGNISYILKFINWYIIAFATPMPHTNYCILGSSLSKNINDTYGTLVVSESPDLNINETVIAARSKNYVIVQITDNNTDTYFSAGQANIAIIC